MAGAAGVTRMAAAGAKRTFRRLRAAQRCAQPVIAGGNTSFGSPAGQAIYTQVFDGKRVEAIDRLNIDEE